MVDVARAGVHSGQGGIFLDSAKPLKGIIGNTLNEGHSPPRTRTPASYVQTGDSRNCEVYGELPKPSHMQGSMPRSGTQLQDVGVPGYRGHIAAKAVEHVRGQTFGAENLRVARHTLPLRRFRRSVSAPEAASSRRDQKTRGLSVAPRVPGYAGMIPACHSETVHALRFADASEAAQQLRSHNPHVSCDGWLRRSEWPVDRLPTYKWNNKFRRSDLGQLFTPAQDLEASLYSTTLGSTFGINPPQANHHVPGDRFLHTLRKKGGDCGRRTDPSKQPAAGQPSESARLDHQRWLMHNTLNLGNGNQRNY